MLCPSEPYTHKHMHMPLLKLACYFLRQEDDKVCKKKTVCHLCASYPSAGSFKGFFLPVFSTSLTVFLSSFASLDTERGKHILLFLRSVSPLSVSFLIVQYPLRLIFSHVQRDSWCSWAFCVHIFAAAGSEGDLLIPSLSTGMFKECTHTPRGLGVETLLTFGSY